ncbi:MAG TPA: alpha/beta hydrolase [Porticoccaceae bacterium]|jgi:pimeloyl-ACP methyl ester carboxylesterase|nr:alpha/beta hydrolase [Gammaproteobacteria bacterium]HIL61636.1 alpha/beta hydrolase [Porticoccaceae bacterium]
MDKTNQILDLKDGRKLGFAEYGTPDGKPVFHFNGSGGSRLERPADLNILTALGIRYISTDRPGHGNSSLKQDRELLDWPNDVAAIADDLGIDKFHVLGWSAGGPHALACAYKIPERVISGAIVSGLAPANRPNPYAGYKGFLRALMILGRRFPSLVYIFRRIAAKQINNPSGEIEDKFVKSLPKMDQIPFENQQVKAMLIADIKEGYKQGGDGPARDDIIINTPWKFEIMNIQTRFDIWQGDIDVNVPVNQGKYQAELLPNNSFYLMENKGHMFLLEKWKDVLIQLIRPTN